MKQDHHTKKNDSGNALIYVLIAIVLFAALTMTMGRQGGGGEANTMGDSRVELNATQIINAASQAKSALDQMRYSGTQPDDLDFTLPGEPDPGTKTIYRVFHADGGGLMPLFLPKDSAGLTTTSPAAGWYMGAVDNIEWTATADPEVILTAYNISKDICAAINKKLAGSTDIPAVAGTLRNYIIPARFLGGGGNTAFNTADCPDCKNTLSFCVSDSGASIFAFYNILVSR